MEAGLLAAADRANLTSSIRPITPPAISGGDKSQNESTHSPSVQVNLSDAGRQRSIESQQQSSVQASAESESAENRPTRFSERPLNTITSSTGESTIALASNTATESLNNTPSASQINSRSTAEQSNNIGTQENANTGTVNNATTAISQQQARPNQNASVVTQYNVTPDSILGQSISTQA
ncbi:hypothetical protein [Marinomonas algicola]|uniref:hypothetical protein n=1 Tax=Marinomonas algicola TaxID=2773454 RepID=UPI00174B0377|nr:hypothetical protein [Marinomonas algicola]